MVDCYRSSSALWITLRPSLLAADYELFTPGIPDRIIDQLHQSIQISEGSGAIVLCRHLDCHPGDLLSE
jgi:hypothetical protein